MADGDTKYVVKLPGNLELHVECDDRPVDFEIIFTGSGKVTFHREQGDDKKGVIKVDETKLTREKQPGGTATRQRWKTKRKTADGAARTAGDDGAEIEFSDPGMN